MVLSVQPAMSQMISRIASALFLALLALTFATALEADLHGICGDCCESGPCDECLLCRCGYSMPPAEIRTGESSGIFAVDEITYFELDRSSAQAIVSGIDRPPRS